MLDPARPADDIELPVLIAPEDHDAGFTMLPVTLRSGASTVIKLTAPPARVASRVYADFLAGRLDDVQDALLRLCCDEATMGIIEKVDVDEIARASLACQQLAFGIEAQKKILRMGRRLLELRSSGSASPASNSPAAAPDGPPATLPDGPSPS